MRWETERRSDNVEDRRGFGVSPVMAGGGLGTVVIIVLALLFGVDPRMLLQSGDSQAPMVVENATIRSSMTGCSMR